MPGCGDKIFTAVVRVAQLEQPDPLVGGVGDAPGVLGRSNFLKQFHERQIATQAKSLDGRQSTIEIGTVKFVNADSIGQVTSSLARNNDVLEVPLGYDTMFAIGPYQ